MIIPNFEHYAPLFLLAPSGSEYISPRPTVVYSRSISISWSPPRYPNGIIIRYEVYRYEMANLATPILSSSTDGSKRNSVVTGLQPYTEYQFTVTACNSEGCTSHSIRTTARTFADGKKFFEIYLMILCVNSLAFSTLKGYHDSCRRDIIYSLGGGGVGA